MATRTDDFELPELPPLADDGSIGTTDADALELAPDRDDVGMDDRPFEDDASDLEIDMDEDGLSWLGSDAEDLDVGADALSTDPEDGWLDDRTMNLEMDLGIGDDDAARSSADEGLEGLPDAAQRPTKDDDSTGLPPLPSASPEDDEIGIADEGRIVIDM